MWPQTLSYIKHVTYAALMCSWINFLSSRLHLRRLHGGELCESQKMQSAVEVQLCTEFSFYNLHILSTDYSTLDNVSKQLQIEAVIKTSELRAARLISCTQVVSFNKNWHILTLACIEEDDGTSQVKYLNGELDYFYTCRADSSGMYPQVQCCRNRRYATLFLQLRK